MQASIDQAIINATRQQSCIPPVLFGLGVEADHIVGSKLLVNKLSRLGFSVSTDEVVEYKQSIMENEDMGELISLYFPWLFSQWLADNIDHSVRTLDGKGILHVMGIVCSTTTMHCSVGYSTMHPIQRQKIKKVANFIKNKSIAVTTYILPEEFGLSKLVFKASAKLVSSFCEPEYFAFDFIWHTTIFL